MDHKFKAIIEPAIFNVTQENAENFYPPDSTRLSLPFRTPEFTIKDESSIIPKAPRPKLVGSNQVLISTVNMNAPNKVIIQIDSRELASFSWRKVKIPVAIFSIFTKGTSGTGLTMSFLDTSSQEAPRRVPVDPQQWRYGEPFKKKNDIYFKELNPPHGTGKPDYWSMTAFIKFPKCSMVYDFWVTARGIESEHKPFEIEFYVDGQKITQANFEEMAKKYPALKADDPRYQNRSYEVKAE